MAAVQHKIELKGGKVLETNETSGVVATANGLDALLLALEHVQEIDNNIFDLDPSATDVAVSMGNITNAQILILVPDGPITFKLNGGTTVHTVEKGLIWFGSDITAISASNPSATESRQVRKYLATTSD